MSKTTIFVLFFSYVFMIMVGILVSRQDTGSKKFVDSDFLE